MTSAGDKDRASGRSCQIGPGTFVAVVGPSGAGKDTLIRAVQAEIGSDPRFHFVRRLVTRTATPGDEDHDTIDSVAFDLLVAEERCALAWRAHGLGYALPLSLDAAVMSGRVAVANLSRKIIDEARRRYRSCIIVEVTAPSDVLLQRLAARGRESEQEIRRRIDRTATTGVDGVDVVRIDNGGPLVAAQSRFLEVLLRLARTDAPIG
jgi:ribose 1,5-bisphosphokinase